MSITRHESGPILSLAVENGSTVYLAGIVPKNLKNDIKGQDAGSADRDRPAAGQVRHQQVQSAAGHHLGHDIRNRAAMNEVWTAWTDPKNLPVRACIEAKLADPACLVEIMVVAAK